MIRYVIQNINDSDLFWNNEFGWVNDNDVDIFSDDDIVTLQLPIEGKWVKVKVLWKIV